MEGMYQYWRHLDLINLYSRCKHNRIFKLLALVLHQHTNVIMGVVLILAQDWLEHLTGHDPGQDQEAGRGIRNSQV